MKQTQYPRPPRQPHRKANPILDGLNNEQKKGATSDRPSVLIVAGPGTGKTRTLTHRLAGLIRESGIDPTNILAVTFTNKAAGEMRRRTGELVGALDALPLISTFHGFCHHFLTRYSGERRGIVDDVGRKDLVLEGSDLARARGVEIKASIAAVGEWIASVKQRFLLPNAAAGACRGGEAEECLEIYRAYQELLERYRLWDFEDLICQTVQLLETNDRLSNVCRKRFRHIVIDEFQDINFGQYKLLRLLMPQIPKGSSLCVIGDPDQSIYGFRGSDVRYFERFTEDYPGTEVIELNRSYRSTETIVQAAVQVISGGKEPTGNLRLFSGIDGHRTLEIIECTTEKAEAVAIGKTIENLMGGTGFHSLDFEAVDGTAPAEELGFSDFAVLARTGSQLNVFEDVFDAAGIPFQSTRKERLLERPGIRAMMSFLRLYCGAGTLSDFERLSACLGNGVGKKTQRTFKAWAAGNQLSLRDAMASVRRFPVSGIGRLSQQHLCDLVDRISEMERSIRKLSVTETLYYLAEHLGLTTEFQNNPNSGAVFRALLNESEAFQNEAEAFLAAMALKTDTDFQRYANQKVSLLTMHAAKGLEFPIVFVSGCEDGLIPYHYEGRPSSRDEERRLFYVAMTRAESRLFLTWCRKRRIFGKTSPGRRSEFVGEIEARLLEQITPLKEKKKKQLQLDLF